MKPTIEQLADLAMQMESNHNIDWSTLKANKHDAYLLMAGHAIEMLEQADNEVILSAAVTHLLVENFMLNLELYG